MGPFIHKRIKHSNSLIFSLIYLLKSFTKKTEKNWSFQIGKLILLQSKTRYCCRITWKLFFFPVLIDLIYINFFLKYKTIYSFLHFPNENEKNRNLWNFFTIMFLFFTKKTIFWWIYAVQVVANWIDLLIYTI